MWKTTCGRTIMGLYDVTDGEIILDGKNIINLSNKEKKSKF